MSQEKPKLTEKKYDMRPKRAKKVRTWTTKPSKKEKGKNARQTKA